MPANSRRMDAFGSGHSSCRSIGAVVVLVLAAITASSCATRRSTGWFQVLPAAPEYLVRSPDRVEIPLLDTLSQYANTGSGWWDLLPGMGLRIENAYYRPDAPKTGLEGYIGTEIARFQVRAGRGLRLASVESRLTEVRPANAPPVQKLIPATQQRRPQHRFFFAIVFKRKDDARNAVLLNAQTAGELAHLATRLLEDPDALCGGKSENCTVFPRTCTVSLEVEVTVNGKKQMLPWGSSAGSVFRGRREVRMLRRYQGRLTRVEIDLSDPEALRLPLLPGDRIDWDVEKR